MANDTNALVALQKSAGQSITTANDLATRIREWNELAHVLTPAISVSSIAPQHVVNVAVVVISPVVGDNGRGDDTYGLDKDDKGLPWLKRGERAINRVGLMKLSQAAGVSWDAALSGRTDDRKERYYWEYKAVGHYVGFDGNLQTIIGTFELDLRNDSPAMKGFTDSQITATRKSGLRICESKAQAAAVRQLGLKQKYTAEELKKPFVILRTSFVPDLGDPEQRRMVAERGLAGASALYPSRQLGAGHHEADTIDVQATRVETVDTSAGKVDTGTGEIVEQAPPTNGNGAQAAGQQQQQQQPAEPTGPTIVNVRLQPGTTTDVKDAQGNVTRKGGRPYTRYFITLSDGRELHTFDTNIGKLAQELMAAKAPIEVTPQESRWGIDIVELRRAQPRLPMDSDGPTDADLKL
jgi:hypothetical protein